MVTATVRQRAGQSQGARRPVFDLDDAFARAEVPGEGYLPDADVAVLEGNDVRDVASPPLVDRLVVVADNTEVRAELREAPDQALLKRIDVLVLVYHDVSDVLADVLLDDARALIFAGVTSRSCTARWIISVKSK